MAKPAEDSRRSDDLDLNATLPVGKSRPASVSDDVTDAEIDEAISRIARKPAASGQAMPSRVDSVQAPKARETVRVGRSVVPATAPQSPRDVDDLNTTQVVPLRRLYAAMPPDARRNHLRGILAHMREDVSNVLQEAMETTHPLPPERTAELKVAGEVLRLVEAATKRLSSKVDDSPEWRETNAAVDQLLIATLQDTFPAVRAYLRPDLLSPDERIAIGEDLAPVLEDQARDGFFGTRTAESLKGASVAEIAEELNALERTDLHIFLRQIQNGLYDGPLPSGHDIERELERRRQILMLWWDLPVEDASKLAQATIGEGALFQRAKDALDADTVADLLEAFEIALAKETERRTTDSRFAVN